MNAITNDQMNFSLGNLSYIGPAYDEGAKPLVKPQKRGTRWFHTLLAVFADWRRRRAVMAEMAMMTDRELADIGISRCDLSRVFDPSFAADHARGRDYIAY